MVVSTISPPAARRVHPGWWAGAALLLAALGAAGAMGVIKWRAAERQDVAAAAVSPATAAAEKAALQSPAEPLAPTRSLAGNGAPDGVSPRAAPHVTAPAASPRACANCGVVEAVTPVQRKGEGTGVGAVVGGVLGGVVGHQMGGGRGKDAMTVIGAVGGGVAGHEVEKRARATTLYRVRVRMDDGSTRTVTQGASIAVGQAVQVEGGRLKEVSRSR